MNCYSYLHAVPVSRAALKPSGRNIGAFRQIAAQLASSTQPAKRWRTTICTSSSSTLPLSSARPSIATSPGHRNLANPVVQLGAVARRHLHCSPSRRLAAMGSVPESVPAVRVFIAGGSYAGLSAAVNLLDLGNGLSPRMSNEPYAHHPSVPKVNFEITIADERDGYYHLIGSPLALADAEYAKKAWVRFQDIPGLQLPNVRFVQGSVSNVDCAAKTATVIDGTTKEAVTHQYDYFVTATGLRRVWPVVPQALTRKQYLVEAETQIKALDNAKDGVVVVGGGAVGIEMAAELKHVKPHLKVTLVHSRDKLMSSEPLPDDCRDKALDMVKETGVEVLMGHRLASSTKVETEDGSPRYEVAFTNGHKMTASAVIMALSNSTPTASYLPSSAVDSEGYVKIVSNMSFEPNSVPNAASHFCAGDVAKWSGIKRCGAAMHGGHYIAHNIHQSVLRQQDAQHEPRFQHLQEIPPMIGLAVGKNAVAYSPDGGLISGPEVMQAYFRDDLGWAICWEYMQLDGRKEVKQEIAAA
ncbi:FAD/NAD(P)-binding domain-containing protein [Trichoderma citrinoviride]|uniref:FAD/NAD(P)-binding domain-containing protein n=1 Tax=Trichoderma citrinoviride TaxID=58853 RepID=A0A2T4AXH9_9HYPO|nr:FAD/NAD(P)-binding domain-containing protein [Trichoderma citrinoviride]PTB61787.1 FAD/NAD(P)-binding domain-containing protein [Trichoderma citrinoviride]